MLLADITLTTELIVLLGAIGGILVSAITFLFTRLLLAKDEGINKITLMYEAQLKIERGEKKSYKEMFAEAVEAMEALANIKRKSEGKNPFKTIASIIPEHSSQITTEQQELADLQTARARLTAANLVLELPAREPGDVETDKQREERLKSIIQTIASGTS